MTLLSVLDPALCVKLVLTLGHFLWQATGIAVLAAAAAWLLRRAEARARYAMMAAALLLMAACPVVTFSTLRPPAEPRVVARLPEPPSPEPLELPFPGPVVGAREEAVATLDGAAKGEVTEPVKAAEEVACEASESAAPAGMEWHGWQELAPHVTSAYLIGVVLMFVRLLVSLHGGKRLRKASRPVDDPGLLAVLAERAKLLGLRFTPAVAYCRKVAAPTVVGVLRPMILLPFSLASGLTTEQVEAILMHELAHIRRYDHLVNLLQRIIEAVLFFHPAVWWVSRRIRAEREHSCDDIVVAAGREPREYAESLVRVAELSRGAQRAARLAASGDRPSQLRSRIVRLIGSGGGPQARLTRIGALALMGALALGITTLVFLQSHAGPAAEPRGEAEADGATYDHFLYLRHDVDPKDGMAKTDTLVLVKVTRDTFVQRDLFTQSNLHIGWKPLGVVGGKVYAIAIDRLLAIDVATRQVEIFPSRIQCHVYDSGRLYALVAGKDGKLSLRVFDFRTRSYRDVCAPDFAWPAPPLAVSPDHKRVAFFKARGHALPTRPFELNVVDLAAGTVRRVGGMVRSRVFETGAGMVANGPPFGWLDPKTILFVPDVTREDGFPIHVRVATMEATTGRMTDVVSLPRWRRRLGEPILRPPGDDGCPRVVIRGLGQYRIDVRAGRLVEDDRIGGDYGWVRGRAPERLYHGNTLLAEAREIRDVAVSPDGNRIVWMWKAGRWNQPQLGYHDVWGKTVRIVLRQWFPEGLLWAAAEELARVEAPKPPDGWTALAPQPYPEPRKPPEPDRRPHRADVFTMSLSTDKRKYWRHQPVKLTVTLTNKSAQDITFNRPSAYTNFGLTLHCARFSGGLEEFWHLADLFPTDPVVIGRGESIRCTRTIETRSLGKHTVEGGFWRGPAELRGDVKARPIRFVVEKSPEDARLLKEKFDRLLARCWREFKSNPARCRWSRFLDLGGDAVPHLIAALEAPHDAEFRRRLGSALARVATIDAVPYFDKLLQGDMKGDEHMVLESLDGMIQRSEAPDAALRLLLAALKHQNPKLRRGAAERVSRVHDERVKAAFETAINDADHRTALTAARYLAAYEELDLADWLARAAQKPTKARYLAARSIVEQLERTWRLKTGDLPTARWEDAAQAPDGLKLFKKALRAWEQWARENPRFSRGFFDADRRHWPKAKPAAPPAGKRAGETDPRLERLWQDLAAEDPAEAYKAVRGVTEAVEKTVTFLKRKLEPVASFDAAAIDRLIAELDNPKQAVRQRAFKALSLIGIAVEEAMHKALRATRSQEVKDRLNRLIANAYSPAPTTAPAWRRLRAIRVLERIGTPEARAVLRDLAAGARDARATQQAAWALRRLGRGAKTDSPPWWLARAEEEAELRGNDLQRAYAFAEIAKLLAEAGEVEAALAVERRIDHAPARLTARYRIAAAYARAGKLGAAKDRGEAQERSRKNPRRSRRGPRQRRPPRALPQIHRKSGGIRKEHPRRHQ